MFIINYLAARCRRPQPAPAVVENRSASTYGPNESELGRAMWDKNKARLETLLNMCEDPNKGNLLPRLVMCRIPISQHLDFQDVKEGLLSGQSCRIKTEDASRIKDYATLLVHNGAKLNVEQVEQFLEYQTTLEQKCNSIWARLDPMSERDKFGQGIDPYFKAFQEMTRFNERSTNPFIHHQCRSQQEYLYIRL